MFGGQVKSIVEDVLLLRKNEKQGDVFKYCTFKVDDKDLCSNPLIRLFKPFDQEGERLENGSYNGAIGEVGSKEV